MSITSGVGIISGIDYTSLLSKMAELSRRPETLIQRRGSVLKTQSDAYDAISSKLTALLDQLKQLLTREDFFSNSATSSNNDALGASVDKTAQAGIYSVRVLQLAQADRLASQGLDSLTAPIASGSGTFNIQVGSNPVRAYAVTAATTLTDLRDMINKDANSGVRASIVSDGSPTTPYHLVLTSKETGTANNIKFITNNTSLNFTDKIIEQATAAAGNTFDGTVTSSGTYTGTGSMSLVMKMTQAGAVDGAARFVVSRNGGVTFDYGTVYSATTAAQDISGGAGVQAAFAAGTKDLAVGDTFRIDAFDPRLATASDAVVEVDGVTINRGTNVLTDVIEGVTLTAKAVTTSAATVTVKNGIGLINAAISQFQQSYNGLVGTISSLTAYDTKTKIAQPLFGESGIRTLRNALNRLITSPVPGATGTHTTLASLGLKLQPDGTLGYDQAKMNDALQNDIEGLMKIFGRIGDSTNSQVQFVSATSKTAAGTYQVAITAAAARATVDGTHALQGGVLGANESLTFTVAGKSFNVGLTAGDTLDQVMSKLNSAFASNGVALEATAQSGALRLQSTGYGSKESFTVVSDQDGALATQLGIGLTSQTTTGTDVAGTINGMAALGSGQTLKGAAGTKFEGLELSVTASAPTTATFTYSSGVADQMQGLLDQYLKTGTGVIQVRKDGISKTIDSLNKQIDTIEAHITQQTERMRKQFLGLESTLAKYQNLGDYISRTLGQLSTTKTS
jgi:flagellar hook-associated protein 2